MVYKSTVRDRVPFLEIPIFFREIMHGKSRKADIQNVILLSITFTLKRCDGGYYPLFCSFWCVAVNTMDKLQFPPFITQNNSVFRFISMRLFSSSICHTGLSNQEALLSQKHCPTHLLVKILLLQTFPYKMILIEMTVKNVCLGLQPKLSQLPLLNKPHITTYPWPGATSNCDRYSVHNANATTNK